MKAGIPEIAIDVLGIVASAFIPCGFYYILAPLFHSGICPPEYLPVACHGVHIIGHPYNGIAPPGYTGKLCVTERRHSLFAHRFI